MFKDKLVTSTFLVFSTAVCLSIIIFLNSTGFKAVAAQETTPTNDVEATQTGHTVATPVQQAVLDHIKRIEDPAYRHILIFNKIEKLLEQEYTVENLVFVDEDFVPEAGRAYIPKDVVVTDSALILNKYADIPEDTDGNRLAVLNTGACIIDSVPYFWGGKASNKGWNRRWGQDVVVSSGSFIAHVATEAGHDLRWADAEHENALVAYGLDCSGFVDWSYWTALGYRIGGSSRIQWANSNPITEEELLPGDLGFLCSPDDPAVNHVGMYIGKNKQGKKMWLHCSSNKGVNISSPEFIYYRRPNIDIYYKNEDAAH